MRRIALTMVAAALVVGGSSATARPVARAPKSTRSPLQVVGKDPAGDWTAGRVVLSPATADALGEDLVSASVGATDKTTLSFVLGLHALPREEIVQQSFYAYGFTVDGADWFVTNGCNPFDPQRCPESVSAGNGFQIAHCSSLGVTETCTTVGVATPQIDVGKGTITVPVPMALVGAKRGSVIGAGGQEVQASPGRQNGTLFEGDPLIGDVLHIGSNYIVP